MLYAVAEVHEGGLDGVDARLQIGNGVLPGRVGGAGGNQVRALGHSDHCSLGRRAAGQPHDSGQGAASGRQEEVPDHSAPALDLYGIGAVATEFSGERGWRSSGDVVGTGRNVRNLVLTITVAGHTGILGALAGDGDPGAYHRLLRAIEDRALYRALRHGSGAPYQHARC